jgi:uncharacterized Ntn-hydrolase superfamily protein
MGGRLIGMKRESERDSVQEAKKMPRPSTYSIVAFDSDTKSYGVAVQSKFISVGSVVPWASSDAGAVATQAYANTTYGPRALELFRKGLSAEKVLQKLISSDRGKDERQVGLVDRNGRSATFTGKNCLDWAGGIAGECFAAQGNILVSSRTVESMASSFESSNSDFPEKLIGCLKAAQKAGGDRRGMQSAALLIVRKGGGYAGFNDRYVDIRVDEDRRPINELERIFRLYDLVMLSRERAEDFVRVTASVRSEIQTHLLRLHYYSGKVDGMDTTAYRTAFREYISVNNFENKSSPRGKISIRLLEYMAKDNRKRK